MKIIVITGSRADYGLLEWPIKTLREDKFFEVEVLNLWAYPFSHAFDKVSCVKRPDLIMVLGDRFEILGAVTAAHLLRIPIAHIGGGDVTEGSYDDAMRDCISRMASTHFVTSTSSLARLAHMGYRNVHLVGNPGIDYIKKATWKKERSIKEPYVVVSYQAETLDGTNEIEKVIESVKDRNPVFILPNQDRGNEEIRLSILKSAKGPIYDYLPHDEFLNLIYHCEEFVGNSSSMLYEAPELGIKTRMVGKRQRGRTIPWGDGNASLRIVHALKYGALC